MFSVVNVMVVVEGEDGESGGGSADVSSSWRLKDTGVRMGRFAAVTPTVIRWVKACAVIRWANACAVDVCAVALVGLGSSCCRFWRT